MRSLSAVGSVLFDKVESLARIVVRLLRHRVRQCGYGSGTDPGQDRKSAA
jgi:hypothetical protein